MITGYRAYVQIAAAYWYVRSVSFMGECNRQEPAEESLGDYWRRALPGTWGTLGCLDQLAPLTRYPNIYPGPAGPGYFTHHLSPSAIRNESKQLAAAIMAVEDQAAQLLATLKKQSASTDTKINQFNSLKSTIKHLRVPEPAQPTIFECVRLAITSQTSSSLASTGFSTLGHLIKRLSLQNNNVIIAAQGGKLFPILQERLGDARESHRIAASQTLTDIWPFAHQEVEKVIREGALAGSVRAKEAGMQWVVKVRASPDDDTERLSQIYCLCNPESEK